MTFTREALQTEFMKFMQGFASSVERLYGSQRERFTDGMSLEDFLADPAYIKRSPLWRAVNEMYDYGICGLPVLGLANPDKPCEDTPIGHLINTLDGEYVDAELFLRGLDSLRLYLDEDCVSLPKLAICAVRTAVARHVLEGGGRYANFEYGEEANLTISEVALLANMDEKSVRNAANPNLPEGLKTISIGKRTFVTPPDAKQWLSGRKGFVPSQIDETKVVSEETALLKLPAGIVDLLNTQANKAGLSVADFIAQKMNT